MGKIVGYTTGVYDMFHIGHLNVIRRAKEQCDYLIVGVSTDELVQKEKNKTPVIPYEERSAIMVGAAEAAIYSVAYSVAMLMQLLNNAVSDAFIPWMYRRLKAKEYKVIEPVTNKLLILVAGTNILLILFAPEVISIFAPARYKDAIWVIPPVAASVFFMFLFQRYINVEVYYGATTSVSSTSILVAVLNIALNYVCIKRWGYLAAGYTTLVSYIVFCVAHYFNLRKVCKNSCEGNQVFTAGYTLGISVAFLVLVFAMMALYEHRIMRFALAAGLCVVAFYKRDFIKWLLKSKKQD